MPGLYCIGSPTSDAPVLVTANYKLTLDSLRKELGGLNLWILVADTRGINVWCAGGKGTFSAEEIGFQVERAKVKEVVKHRELLLPQLGANGVNGQALKKICGFRGKFGPIRAADIPGYLASGTASEQMRSVSFSLGERAALIPLELCIVWKPLLIASLIFFILSGISPSFFSFSAALHRSVSLVMATCSAILLGAAGVPLLLPWIFPRRFWLKGMLLGLLGGGLVLGLSGLGNGLVEKSALLLWMGACSSYLAMNFTGSTPYTSLSGVSQEMTRGLAVQLTASGLSAVLWIVGGFLN